MNFGHKFIHNIWNWDSFAKYFNAQLEGKKEQKK